jgi:hypothetical protein
MTPRAEFRFPRVQSTNRPRRVTTLPTVHGSAIFAGATLGNGPE